MILLFISSIFNLTDKLWQSFYNRADLFSSFTSVAAVITFIYYFQCLSFWVCLWYFSELSLGWLCEVIINNSFVSFNKYSIDHISHARLCCLYEGLEGSRNSRKSCCTQFLLQGSSKTTGLENAPTLGELRISSRVTIPLHLLSVKEKFTKIYH